MENSSAPNSKSKWSKVQGPTIGPRPIHSFQKLCDKSEKKCFEKLGEKNKKTACPPTRLNEVLVLKTVSHFSMFMVGVLVLICVREYVVRELMENRMGEFYLSIYLQASLCFQHIFVPR